MSSEPRTGGARDALCRTLLTDAREDLTKADVKAFGLLSFFGIFFGVLFAGIMAGDWSPSSMGLWQQIVWWPGVGLGVLALFLLCSAVWPRMPKTDGGNVIAYFGDIDPKWSAETLQEKLADTADAKLGRDVHELLAVAKIARKKNRAIQISLGVIAVALVCMVGALMWQYAHWPAAPRAVAKPPDSSRSHRGWEDRGLGS